MEKGDELDNDTQNKKVRKQEKSLIILCIIVAVVMGLSFLRRIF